MTAINLSLVGILVIVALSQDWLTRLREVVSGLVTSTSGVVHAANAPTGGGSGGGGVSLWNVPIIDSSGVPGTIQVDAHDAASAVQNAFQGGNTPTGDASPA